MMEIMSLARSFSGKTDGVVAFYGAGGKTALMHKLADELAGSGKKVLVTTTTKMYARQDLPLALFSEPADLLSELKMQFEHSSIVVAAAARKGAKLIGYAPQAIDRINRELEAVILVEADGSRRKPLKGYAEHEPVIPSCSGLIIPVAGLDALGKAIGAAHVHRLENMLRTTGASPGEIITEEHIAAILSQMVSLGLSQAPEAAVIPILNKLDCSTATARQIRGIAARLPGPDRHYCRLLATVATANYPVQVTFSFKDNKPVAPVSAVLLAAGTASRMKTDKLALTIGGKTVLEHTLDNLRESGIKDVVIVVQPGSVWPERLKGEGIIFSVNPDYRSGMAGSLKAGLKDVSAEAQAAMFVLGDQPLIKPQNYQALIKGYCSKMKKVTCPIFKGKRGNPVIFDRRTWPELLELQGDRGGRDIILSLTDSELHLIETENEAVLIDIDTPEDFDSVIKRML